MMEFKNAEEKINFLAQYLPQSKKLKIKRQRQQLWMYGSKHWK